VQVFPVQARKRVFHTAYGADCGRNADAGMAVRVGGMYGRKRTFSYPKSYGSGSKAAGKALGRAQRQLLMDGTAVKSAFVLLSQKVTKAMRRIRR